LGLSYSKGKKWQVLCGGRTTEEISGQWEPEKTHQLAIVLQTGTQGSVYVDGEHVGNAQCEWENKEDKKISHFYIGGDGGSAGSKKDVSVTVKNVLLYNRPLEDTEIKALNANKVSIPYLEERNTAGVSRSPDGNAPLTLETGDTSTAGPQLTEPKHRSGTTGASGGVGEGTHPQVRDVNATALSSSLGNLSQGDNSDAGTVRGSGILPSLLLL
ncbi:trans-sialidase, putative, partial [Trypanosoma cruzi marinkellei]